MIQWIEQKYDVVVVGRGTGGMGAAVSAARHGARTVLIQDRPVLGGNNSSEIRMHISGADQHALRKNARETGLVEEIALRNRYLNPQNSFCVSDTVYWEIAKAEELLTLMLNTSMIDVELDGKKIQKIYATQLPTEKKFAIEADIFVDATGDGTLAYFAGAEFMVGREAKETFGEPNAQDTADRFTMGNTLMFTTMDMGHPVPFHKPDWAYTYTEEDLKYRKHCDGEAIWRAKAGIDSGYWWIELGGWKNDIIFDGEDIRDELLKVLYGVWDHIKNGGDHGAANLVLDWVGYVPGKRESRRIVGDYVLREQDLMENHLFDDAVAYGGWTLDQHTVGGMDNLTDDPAHLLTPPVPYQIPYRCYYSKDISNLMMAGRNISCSHMAMASTRVMGTCMVGGQAVGVAAAIAVREGLTPREVGKTHIREIQQTLLKDDCYIPELKNEDEKDLARSAKVTASAFEPGYEPEQVINGVHRGVDEKTNTWRTRGLGDGPQWLELAWDQAVEAKQVILRFDSDLSSEIFVSINKMQLLDQEIGVPTCLVKEYKVELLLDGKMQAQIHEDGNYLRHRVHDLEKSVCFDTLRLTIISTNGQKETGLCEIRVYG